MSDWGMKISKDGVDVKDGEDKDMVITSKYPLLKGSISGVTSGTAAAGSGDPFGEGTITTFEITHNLGYIPLFQVFLNYDGDSYYRLVPAPTAINFTCWAGADTTKLYIYCFNNISSSKSVAFKYYIFLDKAKL